MKTALFAGVGAVLLATAFPGFAAPVNTPRTTTVPQPMRAVTFAEITAMADKFWDRMDVNHDGRIDSADRDARMLERFDKWDTNHDGVISKDEFLNFIHAREAKWRAHQPDGAGGPPPPPGHEGWGHEGWGHGKAGGHSGEFAAMAVIGPALRDARQDGVITRAAFDAALKARFDKLDINHDGTLTHEELRAAFGEGWARGRWRHRHWHHGPRREGDMPPPPPPPPSPPAPAAGH